MSTAFFFLFQFAILAYALVGGVFLAFSDFIMRSLALTGGHGGVEAMQVINREVFRWVFMALFLGTLAHIEAVSGHVPFDMRPLGYAPIEAATLLGALGVEGRAYYLSHQIALDTLYPALLASALISTICWFGQRMPNKKLVRYGIALSVGATLFDYVENLGIVAMVWSWPDVSVALVYASSTATILKSASTTLAVLLTLLVGFSWTRPPKADVRP